MTILRFDLRVGLRISLLPGLALGALIACTASLPDEERITKRLDDMAEGLAERSSRAVLAPLADDFTGASGNLDRRAARLLLMREFNAHERLRARVHGLAIERHGPDRASAEFRLVLTGGSGLIPSSGRWYQVTTGWRHDDSDWMLISASWDNVVGP